MAVFTFNKLMRDLIPEVLEKQGKKVTYYTADQSEYYQRLCEKLREETQEFLDDHTVEELADVLEVVYTLAQTKGVSKEGLETVRAQKAQKRGGFSDRLVLVQIEEEDKS